MSGSGEEPKGGDGKRRAAAVWGASPAGSRHAPGVRVGSTEFFAATREARHREVPFVRELVPFAEWRGRRVLELGCGLGYDAADLAGAGADYVGLDLTPENPPRARAHLASLGLRPPLMVADAEALPLPDASVEVVFSNGVLHHTPDMGAALREAGRVLTRGGDLWVALYHRHSVFYWITLFLFDHVVRGGFLKRTFEERLGEIEWTSSAERPIVRTYSRRELRDALRGAGFRVTALHVRRLQPTDLPGHPAIQWLARCVPAAGWRWAGKRWGWYLVGRGVLTS